MTNFSALDNVTEVLKSDKNVISIFHDETRARLIVRIKEDGFYSLNKIKDDAGNEYPVEYEKGPEIVNNVGVYGKHIPISDSTKDNFTVAQGGETCGVVGVKNWGTLGYMNSSLGYASEGNIYRCNVSPGLCSNSHILAPAGGSNQIYAGSPDNVIAVLNCFIPTNDTRVNIDFALGKATKFDPADALMIKQIGKINDVAMVSLGQRVRKYGARSGYTEGRVLGAVNFNIHDRWYIHVYKVTQDFSCPGDSGACVMDDNNNWIGVSSWGDITDEFCTTKPFSYFWATDPRSQGFSQLNPDYNGNINCQVILK